MLLDFIDFFLLIFLILKDSEQRKDLNQHKFKSINRAVQSKFVEDDNENGKPTTTTKKKESVSDSNNNSTAKIIEATTTKTTTINGTLNEAEKNFGKMKYKIKAKKRRDFVPKYFEESKELSSSSSSSSDKTIGKYKIKIKAKRRYNQDDEMATTQNQIESSNKIRKDLKGSERI